MRPGSPGQLLSVPTAPRSACQLESGRLVRRLQARCAGAEESSLPLHLELGLASEGAASLSTDTQLHHQTQVVGPLARQAWQPQPSALH